jgi:hypothetical protein
MLHNRCTNRFVHYMQQLERRCSTGSTSSESYSASCVWGHVSTLYTWFVCNVGDPCHLCCCRCLYCMAFWSLSEFHIVKLHLHVNKSLLLWHEVLPQDHVSSCNLNEREYQIEWNWTWNTTRQPEMHLRSLATSETLWFSASPLQIIKTIVGVYNTGLTEQIGVSVKL